MAHAVAPATLITLALSDVIGSPLDVIASGPTVPDASSWADAWAIVEKYNLADKLPAPVVHRLAAGLAGELPDTPKAGDPALAHTETIIVADNRVSPIPRCGRPKLPVKALLLATHVEGEASQVAKVAVALAKEVRSTGHPVAAPACLVLGGETTVTLGANPGLGGRNGRLALAAALALQNLPGVCPSSRWPPTAPMALPIVPAALRIGDRGARSGRRVKCGGLPASSQCLSVFASRR